MREHLEHQEREFFRGFSEATGLDEREAKEQWAGFSRQLCDSDRQAVEEAWYSSGVNEGECWKAKHGTEEATELETDTPWHGYDALLQDDEGECTLDCGCRIRRMGDVYGDHSVALYRCAMHAAAPELLEALKGISKEAWILKDFSLLDAHAAAIKAITKAEDH